MLLSVEAKPRQTNMLTERFFTYGRVVYTIFLYDGARKGQLHLAQRPESWHFLAGVKNSTFHTKGSKIKNVSDHMHIVARCEAEGDKHVVWRILFYFPR